MLQSDFKIKMKNLTSMVFVKIVIKFDKNFQVFLNLKNE